MQGYEREALETEAPRGALRLLELLAQWNPKGRFPVLEGLGGNAGESNPPETFLTPHIGFEDRGLHQHATHFRGAI